MKKYIKAEIEKQRCAFEAASKARVIPRSEMKHVIEHRDIPYLDDGNPAHRLDVYRPSDIDGVLPVVINIHGGGLVMGSKEFNRHFCAVLSKIGFVVFSLEYRLVPEVTVYDQLRDVASAMDFVQENAAEYGADPSKAFLVGDSGGAYLALYTAAIQRNSKVARAAAVVPTSLRIQRMALISGMFYTTRPDKIGLFLPKLFYGDDYKEHRFHAYMNPEHPQVSLSLPPVLFITSKNDNLRHYTRSFSRCLARNHCAYILRDYGSNPSLTHAFPVFFPTLVQSRQAIMEIAKFFRGKFDILINPDF